MEKFLLVVILILGAVATIFGFALLMAFPVKLAWNYVVPTLFHLPSIDVWQALCLNFLGVAFFKGSCSSSKDSK